ncbi:MAG TPA: NAD(P)H-dependent oxidoreductase [Acidimicrobiales bacterium]|nr:NAD(P)H-dependent oxidoreductase [Acidimicrobiales bacterium]
MTPRRHLLVVFHSQSGGAAAMGDAVVEGARRPDIEGVDVRVRPALEADASDVRWAEALVLGTPENFGYMSGAVKYFFDRVYYEVIDTARGLPYALFVKAGHDGAGAVSSVERIVTGLAWRRVQPPLVVVGDLRDDPLDACRDLGMTMAASLDVGLL